MNFSIPDTLRVDELVKEVRRIYGSPLLMLLNEPCDLQVPSILGAAHITISEVHMAHTGFVMYILDDRRDGRWTRHTLPTNSRVDQRGMLYTCIRLAIEQLTAPK